MEAILGTTDGGKKWVTDTIPAGLSPSAISYVNDTTAWVVYAPYALGGIGDIFVTRDGGRHWNFVTP